MALNLMFKEFFQRLPKLATYIDNKLRFGDLKFNRTQRGLLDRAFGISRHSHHFLVLPALIAAMMTMGVPEPGLRLWLAAGAFIMVFVLLIVIGRLGTQRHLSLRTEMVLQVGLVLAVGGIIWSLGEEIYYEGVFVYRHFFILVASVVGAALLACWFLTGWVWSGWRIKNNYDRALAKTELFVSREQQIPLGLSRFLRAFLTVIQGAPLQLLLLPAVVALFAPPDLLMELTMAAGIISYGGLAMGGFDARLNQMWALVQNGFYQGGTRLVSLVVIALAAARLLGVSYVTTVFDTAEGVVLALLLFSTYILLWWYDYWINRLVAQELIQLLNPAAVHAAGIAYPINSKSVATSVPPEGRVLQVHGASRFIVLGSSQKKSVTYFETYSFKKLFQALSWGGYPGGKATPSPRQIVARIYDFKSLAVTILVVFALIGTWRISTGEQKPQLAVTTQNQPSLEVAQLLDNHRSAHGKQPALIVAASGGGTRAALYTASVLEGLSHNDQLKDVIMGSGVSGGGAALAYFAGHRETLTPTDDNAWNAFFDTMSMPFIQDVINSTLEWRTVSRSRLGVLLSESFRRRWKLAENRDQFGEIKRFGLILNTSIAGQFKCDNASQACLSLPLIEAERRFRKPMTRSDLAGGRLILTNLLLDQNFVPSVAEVGGPHGLPVIVDCPETRLEVAAALNANFPPIFSNAAVDLYNKTRYWVTDGGAVDNRGIEMPLYALRQTLKTDYGKTTQSRLPAITVVAIDASGYSHTYSQDRGVGSLMGAGAQFASQQMVELLAWIRNFYKQRGQKDDFRFIYLPMPLCLRESGSFGTHWMLQPNIEINIGHPKKRRISGPKMIRLLRSLHSPGHEGQLCRDGQAIMAHSIMDARWREGAHRLGFIPKEN